MLWWLNTLGCCAWGPGVASLYQVFFPCLGIDLCTVKTKMIAILNIRDIYYAKLLGSEREMFNTTDTPLLTNELRSERPFLDL